MQRHIIDIRGEGVGDVPSVALCLTNLTEVFLMVIISTMICGVVQTWYLGKCGVS